LYLGLNRHRMLPSASTDHLERMVDDMSTGSHNILDRSTAQHFLHYVNSQQATSRLLKNVKVDDIEPLTSIPRVNTDNDDEGDTIDAPFLKNVNGPKPPKPTPCMDYSSLPQCPDDLNLTHELLNKLVILRLNGGLGTSMGCIGPKSTVEVRSGLSFLDLAVRQVEFLNTKYGVDVPLILMNSFHTDEETKGILMKYKARHVSISTFLQSCFPKLNKTTMQPIPTEKLSDETKNLWYAPGHGDVYASLSRCGLLEQLIKTGKEYLFISNIDNLGATVDLNILYEIMCQDYRFCMEVTKRERQDVMGGALVRHQDKLLLLENNSATRIVVDTIRRDNKVFDKFNTNNLWVDLRSLQEKLSVKPFMALPVIATDKKYDIKPGSGEYTTSYHTAAGSAISLFDDACVVVVPRTRFLPVKTTDDLFAVQSDIFLVKHGHFYISPERKISPPVPTVKLGPSFRSYHDYIERLPFGIPDVMELEHLTVSGDVHFRNHVYLKGTVIIVAEAGSHIDICSGSVIRDKVVTGNLRIMDH